MHVGHRNERAIYNMGNHRLEEVEEEKDLGVLIHRTLSVSVLPRIEKGHDAAWGKRALSHAELRFEGTFVRGIVIRRKKL